MVEINGRTDNYISVVVTDLIRECIIETELLYKGECIPDLITLSKHCLCKQRFLSSPLKVEGYAGNSVATSKPPCQTGHNLGAR